MKNQSNNCFRFPDFLLQLLAYDGEPKSLCEIVGPKTVANHTVDLYVNNDNSIFQLKSDLFEIIFCIFRCNIDNQNIFPFQLLFVVGICFLALSSISSFYLKKINAKLLICKDDKTSQTIRCMIV